MTKQETVKDPYRIILVNGEGEVLDSWVLDAGDEPGTKPVSSGLLKELCYIAEEMTKQETVKDTYRITLINGEGEVLDSWVLDAGDEPGTKPVSSGLLKELCYIAEQAAEEIRKDRAAEEIRKDRAALKLAQGGE